MEKSKGDNNIFSMLKSPYIRAFIKKYKWSYILGILSLIIIDYLQTRIPIILGNVIDGLGEFGNTDKIIVTNIIKTNVLWIIIFGVIVILGKILWRLFIFGAARKIERDIRNDLFSHLEKLSQKYYSNHKTGEIMAYITNDLEALRQAMGQGTLLAFDVSTLLLFTLYNMILEINIVLTLVSVIPLMLIAVFTYKIGPVMFKSFEERQGAFAKMSDFVQENLSGMRVIKAFVQQKNEMKAYENINDAYYDSNMKLMKIRIAMQPVMRGISGLSLAISIGYGGYITLAGKISPGDFVAFVEFLGMLVWPMMAIGMVINTISMGSASLKRIESVLDEEVDIKDSDNVVEIDDFRGNIKINHLSYKYPNTDAHSLHDISFEIKQGQTLGIVGKTGSGKSTLVNLLLRLYNVDRGTIFVSDVDIMDIPLNKLRKEIGYVPQDNFLFSDNIKNNIDFSNGELPIDDVIRAAEFACVNDNIMEFKDGYNTVVGERGVTLSGGQKQRTSIARAIIKNPEILILDDSVSAVDTETEERILSNFKEIRTGKTNIIIAHRISTIQNADLIIVLEDGKIIEKGNHEQLIKNNGFYCRLYNKQLLEKIIDEEV